MEQRLSPRGQVIYVSEGPPDRPVVILIHNMWGSHRTLHRHVALLKDLGYTTITFDLFRGSQIKPKRPFGLSDEFRLVYKLWRDQIDDVANSVKGKKIFFSLSGPSLPALLVASRRQDVVGCICDGGPFTRMWDCIRRLFALKFKSVRSAWLKDLMTTVGVWMWGRKANADLHRHLQNWNPKIPILSIRGEKDPIVFWDCIDLVFRNLPLPVEILSFPEGSHLDGLKQFEKTYRDKVSLFLTSLNI